MPDRWPNGRKFWTVENPGKNQVLVGPRGGVTKFLDREQAKAAADDLNGIDTPSEVIE